MNFALADIYTDARVLTDASEEVKRILSEDPELALEKHANLKIKMKEIFAKEDVTLSL
jgi:antitoxin component HigA of HigAB toxin-antitoxin module